MGITGAGGNTYVTWRREGRISGSANRSDDHPAGVSPKPCKKTRAAASGFLQDDDDAAGPAEEEDVDMAADTDAMRRLKNMQEPSMHKPSRGRNRR